MTDKKIAAAWAEYERLTVPYDADEEFRFDLRQTFYSGAAFMFTTLALLPSSDAAIQDAVLYAMHREINEWGADVGGRKYRRSRKH